MQELGLLLDLDLLQLWLLTFESFINIFKDEVFIRGVGVASLPGNHTILDSLEPSLCLRFSLIKGQPVILLVKMCLLETESHRGTCLALNDPHDHVLLISHDFAPSLVFFVLWELDLHLEALIVLVRHEHDVEGLEPFRVFICLLPRILDFLVPR